MTLPSNLFILGSHKSGTSLLRALLDGHPELYVIPLESHFFRHAGHWIRYPLMPSAPAKRNEAEIEEALIAWIRTNNREAGGRYADSHTVGRWDEDLFARELRACSDALPLFDRFARAAALATGQPDPIEDGRIVIEKSVENLEIATRIAAHFPRALFIHIVRNPYANLVALRKKLSRFPYLARELRIIEDSLYYATHNGEVLRGSILILRYEDLALDAASTMQSVAEFLAIPFRDSMLQPTTEGKPWQGNSTSGEVFERVSKAPLLNWKEDISDIEIALVNATLPEALAIFGYDQVEPARSPLLPAPGERPAAYLMNRLLWHFRTRSREVFGA